MNTWALVWFLKDRDVEMIEVLIPFIIAVFVDLGIVVLIAETVKVVVTQ